MSNSLLYSHKQVANTNKSSGKALLLAVETGVCLTGLSTAAWGQSLTIKETPPPNVDEPPNQVMVETKAVESIPVATASLKPERTALPEFIHRSTRSASTITESAKPTSTSLESTEIAQFTVTAPPTTAPEVESNQPLLTESVSATNVAPEPISSEPRMSPPLTMTSNNLPIPAQAVETPANSEASNRSITSATPAAIAPESRVSTQAHDLLNPRVETTQQPQFSAVASGGVEVFPTAHSESETFPTTISEALDDLAESDDEPHLSPQLAPDSTGSLSLQTVSPQAEPQSTLTNAGLTTNVTLVEDSVPKHSTDVDSRDVDLSDDNYLVEPTFLDAGALSPLATTIPVDGDFIEYDETGDVTTGASFGDDRSANLEFDSTFTLHRTLQSSTTTGNVTVLQQEQNILRAQNILRERELSISRQDPVTVIGQNIQLSVVADCADLSGNICTYTPGLVTDRDSIDPDTLLPTQFDQTANFGDVVTPESLAAMQEPGFQLGANGQQVGLDLYFPNTTSLAGNTQTSVGEVIRDEQFETMPAIAYSEIFQSVAANANEASLARTIRGPAVIFDTEQPIANLVLAAASMLLPEVEPFVPDTSEPSNPNISQGLFYAANNTRIPSNSFTLYQAGVGHSATPTANATDGDVPSATFNAVWLGLSPVTERSYSSTSSFSNASDPRIILSAGGEGGELDTPEVLSFIDGELFSSDSLQNAYTQNYFTLFEQDADRVDSFIQNDRIRYYPHLSFTGNVTGESDIVRYYAGTITGETVQAYGGVNYQGQTTDGLSYRAGAIGYINPSYDRYSNLSAGLSQRFNIGDRESLTLGSSFNWALDQDTSLEDIEQTGQGSDITLQAWLDLGDVSIGASQIIGDVLPNSQESRTVFDTAVKLGEDVTVAGFWAPFDNATSSARYGVLADIGFRVGGVDPHLIFSWQNTYYEYGQDLLGNELTTSSDTFEILLKLDW